MKVRRFYEYVEREPHEVNGIWKFLHLLIFALISLNSMLGAYNFGIIFDIFNYHCILYARPSFTLTNIVYDTASSNEQNQTTTSVALVDIHNETQSIEIEENMNGLNPLGFISSMFHADQYFQGKVPNTENYYVINREIFFVNKTLRGRVKIRMMHTVFATLMMCNMSFFIPLISVTISSAFIVFVMFCGKGGKALSTDPFPGSWLYVYPVLIVSVIMSILYAITSSVVTKGFEEFCAGFRKYTGQTHCTRFMNYFTTQQLAGHRHLWQKITFCHIVYPLGAILWMLQLVLTIFRILNVADFHFKMVVIAPKKAEWTEEDEEIELGPYSPKTPLLYEVAKKVIKQPLDVGKIKAV